MPYNIGDLDGGGSVFTLADDELDITCGCEIPSPSPIYVASDPLPTTLAPFPSAAPTCGEGDSFSIESEFFPEAEGCFVDTAVVSNDRPVYTISGTVDQGQVVVLALELTEDDPSSVSYRACGDFEAFYHWGVCPEPCGFRMTIEMDVFLESTQYRWQQKYAHFSMSSGNEFLTDFSMSFHGMRCAAVHLRRLMSVS